MEFRHLGQIIVGVLEAKKWFQGIGVPTAGTRLDELDAYLHELLNPTDSSHNPFSADPDGPEAYHALADALGFSRIARRLSALPSHLLPRRALKDALVGPFRLSDETDSCGLDARNKFVELELAAFCLEAGLGVIGFDDVRFTFEGCTFGVECKRPRHPGTFNSNLSKAYQQLGPRLHEYDRGIVAMAVDRAFGLDSQFQSVDSEDDLRRIGASAAQRFGALVVPMCRQWLDPRIVAVAAIVRFLARPPGSTVTAYSYQVALIKIASENEGQAVDSARLDRLAVALRSGTLTEQPER